MRLYIAAAVAAIALLVLTSGVLSLPDDIGATEQQYMSMLKLLGCAASCPYVPLNWFQLLLCAVTSQKGSSLDALYGCAFHPNEDQCKEGKFPSVGLCFWLPRPEHLKGHVGPGACLPASLHEVVSRFSVVESSFAPVLFPPTEKIPEYFELIECMKHSHNPVICTKVYAWGPVRCGLTDAINTTFYPIFPEPTRLCVQTTLIKRINELLSTAPGPQREKCPKLSRVCEACFAKECPGVSFHCPRVSPEDCSRKCPSRCRRDCFKPCAQDCPLNCSKDCPTCPTKCPDCLDCNNSQSSMSLTACVLSVSLWILAA